MSKFVSPFASSDVTNPQYVPQPGFFNDHVFPIMITKILYLWFYG